MRVELYGCPYKGSFWGDLLQLFRLVLVKQVRLINKTLGSLISYGAPEGDDADGLTMKDFPFDGINSDGELSGGLGKLYDGSIGADNFEKSPSRWIGWRTEQYRGSNISVSNVVDR